MISNELDDEDSSVHANIFAHVPQLLDVTEQADIQQKVVNNKAIVQSLSACFLYLADGFIISSTGPSLAMFRQNTKTQEIGFVLTFRAIGYIIASLTTGKYFDICHKYIHHNARLNSVIRKYSHVFWIIMSVILLGVSVTSLVFITSVHLLFFMHFIVGLASGSIDAAAHILCLWAWQRDSSDEIHTYTPSTSRVRRWLTIMIGGTDRSTTSSNLKMWYNGVHFFFGVGAFLCPLLLNLFHPLVANQDMDMDDIVQMQRRQHYVYLILGGIAISGLVWVLGYALVVPNRENKTREVYTSYDSKLQAFKSFLKKLFSREINLSLMLSLAMACLVGSQLCYAGLIHTFVTTNHPHAEKAANYITSAFWLSVTFGRLACMPLSYYLPSKLLLLFTSVESIVSIAILMIWGSSSLTMIWIGTIAFGLGVAAQFPLALSYPTTINIQMTGIMTSVVIIGASLGDMIISALVSGLGTNWLFTISLIMMSMVLVIYILMIILFRQRAEKPVEEHDDL